MRWLCPLILCVVGCGERNVSSANDDGPRIVSLSPAASIMLRDAGLEPSIVGRHGWDMVLDQSLPVAGDQTGLDYERLISLEPTHVVIEWGSRDLPDRLVELADSQAFRIVPIETLTLDDIEASDAAVRSALNVPTERVTFDPAREPRAGWGSVLLVVATSPSVDCLGPGSAHHELLTRGGFTPALADGAPWITLGLEDAIRLDPDCIVLIQPKASPDTGEGAIGDRLGPLAQTNVAAVRSNRIVLIDDSTALIPSTNLANIARDLWAKLDALGPLPSPP
ncbi:MAG: hypothetical protein AAFN41_04480 [Planctomycetota bacterium]